MTHYSAQAREVVAGIIGADDYTRSRLHPVPGETFFLHLKDLRDAIARVATSEAVRLLDFGCGSSPYRPLFPKADYRRADYVPSVDLDYLIGDDQLVASAPESFFEVVLSTQVLEHVREPRIYLSECLRLLRPGGRLILTTHGLFEEHGCPYDFRRWTAEGLSHELRSTGFDVKVIWKLTTAGRAAGLLFRMYSGTLMGHRRRQPLAFLHWLLFRTNTNVGAAFDRWCDRKFANCAVVETDLPGHELHIALLIVGEKPVAG